MNFVSAKYFRFLWKLECVGKPEDISYTLLIVISSSHNYTMLRPMIGLLLFKLLRILYFREFLILRANIDESVQMSFAGNFSTTPTLCQTLITIGPTVPEIQREQKTLRTHGVIRIGS